MARGVRDFCPEEKILRDEVVAVLKKTFESFGYNPLETPTLERYELFASKFGLGEESDAMRETFKLKDQGGRDLVLRTEFTIPFARFIAMNPKIKKPFKRFQMGSVFRDGPIKLGRYREFWQCDVDAVGISEPAIDAEMVLIAREVFKKLNLDVEIKINNRKILNAVLERAGILGRDLTSAIISIDKFDKIGADAVLKELAGKGIDETAGRKALKMLCAKGENNELVKKIKNEINENDGLNEITAVLSILSGAENIVFTASLARGLAYYTGNVFEIYLRDKSKISASIAAGGRYDDMIGKFLGGKEKFPAVGISFGLETIIDAIMISNKRLVKKSVVDCYFIPLAEEYLKDSVKTAQKMRDAGINVDICYLFKLKKALEYAASYAIPWVVIYGEDEEKQKKYTLRNMLTGEQEAQTIDEINRKIKK